MCLCAYTGTYVLAAAAYASDEVGASRGGGVPLMDPENPYLKAMINLQDGAKYPTPAYNLLAWVKVCAFVSVEFRCVSTHTNCCRPFGRRQKNTVVTA